jgi:hypothetical protein
MIETVESMVDWQALGLKALCVELERSVGREKVEPEDGAAEKERGRKLSVICQPYCPLLRLLWI